MKYASQCGHRFFLAAELIAASPVEKLSIRCDLQAEPANAPALGLSQFSRSTDDGGREISDT